MGKKIKIMYLLLGMGIGFIICSAVNTLFPVIKEAELSENEIIERAKELGMVSLKESLEILSSSNNLNNVDISEGKNENSTEISKEEVENINEKLDNDNKEKSNGKYDEEDIKTVKFAIKWKETLTDVANNLHEMGLIDDVDKFISYAIEKGYSKILRVGEYEIDQNLSYDDILKILTKRK
ncbi:MAG TPA: hypothetical protein VIK77_11155 [Tissierellaceae bacterium]